jgi:E3 ubiquitin-protein ligase HERC2
MFWNVVESLTNDERRLLLLFTWGQSRLPPSVGGMHMKLTLAGRSDGHLPTSHTCFFALDLPEYSSEAILREKLLFAIQFCKAVCRV